MKKILSLPTVIVFLITFLVAGGCGSPLERDNCVIKNTKRVKIYLKAIVQNGEKHLQMYDSNDTTKLVVDDLETCVMPGMKVIWKRAKNSGIKKITKIGPKNAGKIIIKDATRVLFTKKFKLKIPKKAPYNTEEKYDIDFLDKDSKPHSIDPYLKIPKKQADT